MSNERDEATRRRSAETEYRDRFRLRENLRVLLRFGRAYVRLLKRHLERTEQELGYLNGVGYIVGHVLSSTHSERFAVETKVGFRYLVGCDSKLDKKKITEGTRVFMEENTLTIMGILPRQVESEVHNMIVEDPVKVSYAALGGLSDQIRELRESIELPLMNPEIFQKVGIRPPKAVLLYGPPGTGKTLLARAIASNVDAKFLNVEYLYSVLCVLYQLFNGDFLKKMNFIYLFQIITSTLSVKFPGEGSDLIRRIFSYARDNQPCIIFMDEIDGICARRLEEGTAGDREIRRTLTELLHQMDECNGLEKVKVIMATNRRDVLDPALLRAGRFDRQIEIPLPNNHSRMQILQIYAAEIAKQGEIDYEAVVKLSEGFNGADLRNVCTEAGMLAIRANRDYAINIDFMKAVRKLIEAKQLESTIH